MLSKDEFKLKSCTVPFLSISTNANGTYSPCCWLPPFVDDLGNAINFNKSGLDEVWNSNSAIKLRNDFLGRGANSEICKSVCFDVEAAGGISKRKSMLTHFFSDPEIFDSIFKNPNTLPKLVEVKITNLCNLRCKTCIPENSSSIMSTFEPKWETDKPRIIEIKKNYTEYLEYRGRPFLQSLLNNIQSIEWLEFYGGEPFMIKDLKWFLSEIKKTGRAEHITLSFITNGTIIDNDYIEFFSHFKSVIISISIDAFGEKNDEIRVGSSWETIDNNLRIFCDLANRKMIDCVNVNTTISILNLINVFDLANYLNTLPAKCTWSLTVLHEPQDLSVDKLSTEEKEEFKILFDKFVTDFAASSLLTPINILFKNIISKL